MNGLKNIHQAFEQHIISAAPQPAPSFRQALSAQLSKQFNSPIDQPLRRRKNLATRLAFAAAAVLLISLFLVTPTGKAMIETILNLGYLGFTRDSTPAEKSIEDPPDHTVSMRRQSFSSAEEASLALEMPVYTPSVLPQGYPEEPFMGIEAVVNSEGKITNLSLMYFHEQTGKLLGFSQIPLVPAMDPASFPLGIGDAEMISIEISGADGVFIKGANWGTRTGENGELEPVPYNLLIWELNDFQFWIFSEDLLPLAELMQVADSMAP